MGINRHLSRIVIMQSFYEWDFRHNQVDLTKIIDRNFNEFAGEIDQIFCLKTINGIVSNLPEIDKMILKAAPNWPLDQVARLDLNVLRIALFELLYDQAEETPPRVIINEAVEIGKQFGSENASKFINGVLGTIYRENEAVLAKRDNLKNN